jgi:hypothetical protein
MSQTVVAVSVSYDCNQLRLLCHMVTAGPVDPQTVCSLGEGNDSVLTSHLANNTVPPSDLSSNVPDRSDLSQKPQAPSQVTSQTATCYTHFDAESAPTSAGRNVHGTTAAAGSLSDSPWQGLEAPKAFYLSASGIISTFYPEPLAVVFLTFYA